MKSWSEVFIEQIFLRILESGNSDYLHKSRVRDWRISWAELQSSPLNVSQHSELVIWGPSDFLQTLHRCVESSAFLTKPWKLPWKPSMDPKLRTTPLELFLNYDCDVDEKNIFEAKQKGKWSDQREWCFWYTYELLVCSHILHGKFFGDSKRSSVSFDIGTDLAMYLRSVKAMTQGANHRLFVEDSSGEVHCSPDLKDSVDCDSLTPRLTIFIMWSHGTQKEWHAERVDMVGDYMVGFAWGSLFLMLFDPPLSQIAKTRAVSRRWSKFKRHANPRFDCQRFLRALEMLHTFGVSCLCLIFSSKHFGKATSQLLCLLHFVMGWTCVCVSWAVVELTCGVC